MLKLLYLHQVPQHRPMANIIQVLHMCRGFKKAGVDITLGLPMDSKKSSLDQLLFSIRDRFGTLPDYPVRTYPSLSFGGKGKGFGAYIGARNLLRDMRHVDACMVRSVPLAQMVLRQNLLTLYEAHAERLHTRSFIIDRLYRSVLLQAAKKEKLGRFICISRALADRWQRFGVPREKLMVLHDGVSEEDFQEVISQESARKKVGLPRNGQIVVYTGNLDKNRGIDQIVHLANDFPTVLFVVVGGSEEQKAFWQNRIQKTKTENMLLTGHVSNARVKDYLFAADVLLMMWTGQVPTIGICSPLKVFEYMAAQRIIVGPGFPTIREILVDGEDALLSNEDDYESLRIKISEALKMDPASLMARKARQKVMEQYTWEKRAAAITRWLEANRNAPRH